MLNRFSRGLAFVALALMAVAMLFPGTAEALVTNATSAELYSFLFGGGTVSLAMSLPTLRRVDSSQLVYDTNTPSEIPLPLTFMEESLIIEGTGVHTPTADGTAVREYPVPIDRIQVIANGNTVLHDARPDDLIRDLLILEQTPQSALLSGPATITLAGGAKPFSFKVPLNFRAMFAEKAMADLTHLPTFAYNSLTLRIVWAGRDSIVRGGTGAITVSPTLTMVGVADDWSKIPGSPKEWGARLARTGRRFDEIAVDASAQSERKHELDDTNDIRSLMIIAEDATGDGSNDMLNAVTLKINNQTDLFARVPFEALRAHNAKVYGVAMPPGVAIIDFAEDKDILDIFEAPKYGRSDLVFDRNAVAGTIRVAYNVIVPGRQ